MLSAQDGVIGAAQVLKDILENSNSFKKLELNQECRV